MNKIWQDCLFPVMLGAGTVCHACVRHMNRRLGVESTVLTGKRALTLRFMPGVHLITAPPTLPDDILLNILSAVNDESGLRVPLLVLCDESYADFVERNQKTLESQFVLRRGEAVLRGDVLL